MTEPLFLNEAQVKSLLSWNLLIPAIEQSLAAVSAHPSETISAMQPARSFTILPDNRGVLFSMPGFLRGRKVDESESTETEETLACKLVTSFKNDTLKPPLPNVLATILLFDAMTGKLKCVMEATEITTWRTAAASVVATKNLHTSRGERRVLSILGAGTQGRIHAIAMQKCIPFEEVRIWNHNPEKAELLAEELKGIVEGNILACNDVRTCVQNADVIVTATYAQEPFLHIDMVKNNVHINGTTDTEHKHLSLEKPIRTKNMLDEASNFQAVPSVFPGGAISVGAGTTQCSELSPDLYRASVIYVDHWAGAKNELAALKDIGVSIKAELGEVILGYVPAPLEGITIYHSLGMAVQDAATANLIYNLHCKHAK